MMYVNEENFTKLKKDIPNFVGLAISFFNVTIYPKDVYYLICINIIPNIQKS